LLCAFLFQYNAAASVHATKKLTGQSSDGVQLLGYDFWKVHTWINDISKMSYEVRFLMF